MIGYHSTLLGATDQGKDLKIFLEGYDRYRAYMGDSFSELYPLLVRKSVFFHLFLFCGLKSFLGNFIFVLVIL